MKTVNKTLCVCLKSAGPEGGHLDPASVFSRPMNVSLLTATQLCWLTSAPLSLQSIINPQSYWSPTASPHCRVCSVCGGPGCPHLALAFPMVARSGSVPSAHDSGYCIIFSHRLTSSPTESISTSSFPIFTVPAGV